MKIKYFFSVSCLAILISLSAISFISAEACPVIGAVNYDSGIFCNTEGQWETLLQQGASCLNDFECVVGLCVEGKCQNKFESMGNVSLLTSIWNWFQGVQCDPKAIPLPTKCDGTKLYTCGAYGAWEGGVDSVQCGYDGGGNNGGNNGGSSCTSRWVCTNWSNKVESCGTRTCTDTRCSRTSGKPAETKTCPSTNFCGDGTCDSDEVCGDANAEPECLSDCGLCSINLDPVCGDNNCERDKGESSASCAEDCPATKPKNRIWMFWVLVVFIILMIIFVGFLLYKKIKERRQEKGNGAKIEITPKIPPSSFSNYKNTSAPELLSRETSAKNIDLEGIRQKLREKSSSNF